MKIIALLLGLALAANSLYAEDVDSLIKKGDDLDKQMQTEAALQAYLAADKEKPNDANILHRIAKEYGLSMTEVKGTSEKRERGETALKYAKQAVEADPNNAQAQLALAISYGRLANLMDNKTKISYSKFVKEHAEIAAKLDPSNDLPPFILGSWNYELANLNPFVRSIAKMIYGSLPDASNEDALAYFKKAAALNPNRLGTHVELGRTYAALGQKAEAKAALNKALSMPNREKDDPEAKEKARKALASL